MVRGGWCHQQGWQEYCMLRNPASSQHPPLWCCRPWPCWSQSSWPWTSYFPIACVRLLICKIRMSCSGFPTFLSIRETLFFFFFSFVFRATPRHMEVPRPGVKSELHLPTYATATATPDLRHVCNLHQSSRRILNPPSKARDPAHILKDSWIIFYCATTGTPRTFIL